MSIVECCKFATATLLAVDDSEYMIPAFEAICASDPYLSGGVGEDRTLARASGTYLRYRDKLAKPDLLIFDDFGMRKLCASEAQDLCEILEERSLGKSVIFTTQLPLDHWSEVIADPVIADAIRDRLSTPCSPCTSPE